MRSLRTMWSSTDFGANELTRYASAVMCREARQGIFVLGILTMVLMAGLALLYHALGFGAAYPYTFGVLALLALHVAVSARAVTEIKVLYLLGMMLLAASGQQRVADSLTGAEIFARLSVPVAHTAEGVTRDGSPVPLGTDGTFTVSAAQGTLVATTAAGEATAWSLPGF